MNWVNSLYKIDLLDLKCEKIISKGEPISRGYHTATLVNRFILIYAGYNGKYILGDLVALDTENLVWSLPDPCLGHFPTARNAQTVTMIGSELFMFGGYNGTRDTNDLHILETSAFSTLQDDLKLGINIQVGKITEIIAGGLLFRIHTVILQARCPQLLDETIWEKLNISKNAMELLIEYLYCDLSSENIPLNLSNELLDISIKLNIDRLRSLCNKDIDLIDSSLTSDIMNINKYQDLSDFTIIIEGKEFYLHKIILGSRCPYFRAMFQSGMSENSENQLRLDYFTASAFEYIVEWIYSDKFSLLIEDNKVEIDIFIQILVQCNMLGLEGLMRMTEIAAEEVINIENVVKLYEISHVLGAIRLKSYTINYILREFDKISINREVMNINDSAFEELNNYLPKRMKRQTSKNGIFPALSLIKFDKSQLLLKKNLNVKPHNPRSSRLPSRDLQGTISLRNPLNNFGSRIFNNCASPQPRKYQIRRQARAATYQIRENKNTEPPEFMVQGISPRSFHSVERSPALRNVGLQISSSLNALYQHTFMELSSRSRFLLYK